MRIDQGLTTTSAGLLVGLDGFVFAFDAVMLNALIAYRNLEIMA